MKAKKILILPFLSILALVQIQPTISLEVKSPYPGRIFSKEEIRVPKRNIEPVRIIDKTGAIQSFPQNLYYFSRFSEGLIVVGKYTAKGLKFGYADDKGNIAIEPLFDFAHDFHDGVAIVEEGYDMNFESGLYSIIDKKGNFVRRFSRAEADKLSDFENGYAVFRRLNHKKKATAKDEVRLISEIYGEQCDYGFVDKNAKELFTAKFEDLKAFSEKFAQAKLNGKWGYINEKGEFVIAPKYDFTRPFSEGLAAVRSGDKTGFIDRDGNQVIKTIYQDAGDFKAGLAPVKVDGNWGFINKDGQMKIAPKFFQVIDGFNEEVAICGINTLPYKQTDTTAALSFPKSQAIFYQRSFSDQYKPLTVPDYLIPQLKFGLINKSGEFLTAPDFDKIFALSDGLFLVQKNNKFGYIDLQGKIVVEPKYADAESFSQGKALVTNGRLNRRRSIFSSESAFKPNSKVLSFTPWPCRDPVVIDENLVICKKVSELVPEESIIYRDIAWFEYAMNRKEKAIEAYTTAFKKQPDDFNILTNRAEVYLSFGNWKQAENDLTSFLENNQIRSSGHYPKKEWMLRAIARIHLGDLEGAQKDLLDQSCSDCFQNRKLKGNVSLNDTPALIMLFEALKDFDTAETIWSRYYREENEMPPFFDYPKTMPELELAYQAALKAISELPENGHQYVNRRKNHIAACLLEKIIAHKIDRYETADIEAMYKQLISLRLKAKSGHFSKLGFLNDRSLKEELNSDWIKANCYLLRYYAHANNALCAKIYDDLLANGLANSHFRGSACGAYGNYLLKNGKEKEAEKIFEFGNCSYFNVKSIRAYSKYLRSKNKLAEADKILSKKRQSERQFSNWGALPSSPVPGDKTRAADFIELAQISLALGYVNSAMYFCQKADSSNLSKEESKAIQYLEKHRLPDEKVDYKILSLFFQCLNEDSDYSRELEISLCKQCIQSAPRFLAPYVRAAQILMEEGIFDQAEKLLDAALSINPGNEHALIMKGRLYAEKGSFEKARKIFSEVLEFNPSNQTVQHELSIISNSK